jgi:energy-coupling factor transporter ATP-binding protein EcfA2
MKQKTTKPRRVRADFSLPKVTKRVGKAILRDERLPLNKVSYSTFTKFSAQPILFKINALNGDIIESTNGVSSIMGRALHEGLAVYFGKSDEHIISTEAEGIEWGLKVATKYLEDYNDGFISYSKRVPTKAVAIDCVVKAFNYFVKDIDTKWKPDEVLLVEEKIEHQVDVEWNGKQVNLPIPLNGRVDRVIERDGKIIICDPKMVGVFSPVDKIDGAKMIQTAQYYFLVYAHLGREPHSVVFEEIKYTKNKDGSPQVRRYEIVIKENQLFFDFYFRLYEDLTKALLGEMVYVPNINDMYDSELAIIAYVHRLDMPDEVAKQMKKHRVDNVTDLLKRKIHKASLSKKILEKINQEFAEIKNINYAAMQNHEKIQTKLLEHGIAVHHHSTITGNTVDLYQFEPSIGVKMNRVATYVADIEQVLGVSGVRVLAPIPNTTFIGFEVPRETRTYPKLPRSKGAFITLVGEDIKGECLSFDLRKAPHTLVAGAAGSGKSMFLNSLITQLHKQPTKEVHTYLIDPKEVELAQFANDKHVKAYVTAPEAVVATLRGLVEEMDNRYSHLKKAGVKQNSELSDPLPYLFTIIDEYADIAGSDYKVMVGTKTVSKVVKGEVVNHEVPVYEKAGAVIAELVQRLAQKARAAGIHIVLATQRPSVTIINGDIKANFTTKVVFRTAKETDSRIVLDERGAEKLKGEGDALFSDARGITRVQTYSL